MNKWTDKALARLAVIQEQEVKAADLDIIVQSIKNLPYGQLKKVLTEDVLAVLERYGYGEM